MTEKDLKLYSEICRMIQKELMHALSRIIKKCYKESHITKKYVYAVGEIPIALVAHTDTVFKNPPSEIYYDDKKNLIWSPQGGIGDDRAGIFIILKLLQKGLRPSIIFCTDEEIGGFGAYAFCDNFKNFDTPVNYIIELDRANQKDCVFYNCKNEDFSDYISSFGFEVASGTFTDIAILAPHLGIAAVNLSVGYVNEHSYKEVLHIDWLEETIEKVAVMLSEELIPAFEYVEAELSEGKCAICGKKVPFSELELGENDIFFGYICRRCINNFGFKKCGKCDIFIEDYKELCSDCEKGEQ